LPQHRTFDPEKGTYSLVKFDAKSVFKDNEGKSWTGFPPPLYSPGRFVANELPSFRSHPSARWIHRLSSDLPGWFYCYIKVEKCASTSIPVTPVTQNDNQTITPSTRPSALNLFCCDASSKCVLSGKKQTPPNSSQSIHINRVVSLNNEKKAWKINWSSCGSNHRMSWRKKEKLIE
jgi:hypothetical protein